MFAITTVIKYADGTHVLHNGIMQPCPAELRSNSRLAEYLRIASPGWKTDDLGFKLFTKVMADGTHLIFPALELIGDARARKRFPDFKPFLDKGKVEALANSLSKIMEDQQANSKEITKILTHDLRVISRAIYQNADSARDYLELNDQFLAKKRIETVIAAQAILKMRIDALDLDGKSYFNSNYPIAIYKKVDKVVSCLKEVTSGEEKTIILSGSSTYKISGPDVLELAPYAILDNAIKYSPKNSQINVFLSDSDGTHISITSFGPKIQKKEQESIFNVGIRGASAKETGLPGSGFGLHMAKKIVSDMFGGSIHVQQSQSETIFWGEAYYETTFTMNLPSSPPAI